MKNIFSYLFVLFFCFLFYPVLSAQDIDSLCLTVDRIITGESRPAKADRQSFRTDSLTVIHYLSECSRLKTVNTDSAFRYIEKALAGSVRLRSTGLISLALQELGEYCTNHEMYEKALRCFQRGLAIEEKRNDILRIADFYSHLGMVHFYMEIFDKALDYNQKALEIYREKKDTTGVAKILNQMGLLHNSREFCEKRTSEERMSDLKTAIVYYEQALEHYKFLNDGRGQARVNQNIAAVYNRMGKPETALGYVRKSLDYYREINDTEGILGALYTIGKTYYNLRDYKKSIAAYRESEALSLKGNFTGGIQYLYEAMAMPYYDSKDYRNAYDYYLKYMTLRDSVYNAEKSRQIIELETRYQSQVKENEILRLTGEKKRKNSLIYMLTGLIILLGLSIFYYLRLLRKNREISEKDIQIKERKIQELENEKRYLAARSVMEGEESERSRLAGDLHNGLGGLLSGIKINLSSMKENAIITHENVASFNHAISLLDTSISELRRIAHNLMPETLNHYGLKAAVEDFCTQVSPAGPPEIKMQFFGEEIRYTKEIELAMYRVIQELVNNSLKHSGATEITVQLISEPERVYIQVIDNGRGFNPDEELKAGKGKGLENIRDRVTALGGKFDIWSSPGQGTEASVEIEIS